MNPAAAHPSPERIAVTFARVLRGVGLAVPIGAVLTFVDALGSTGETARPKASG